MPWYRQLHNRILAGLILGVLFGLSAAAMGWTTFASTWISPWGDLFLNALKMLAVPLVLASLVTGLTSLGDFSRLSAIGGRTVTIYILTTVFAVSLGLLAVNTLKPGEYVPEEIRAALQEEFVEEPFTFEEGAVRVQEQSPLAVLAEIVPENIVGAASNNRNMLQVVFFALLLGIGLLQLPKESSKPLVDVMGALSQAMIRLVRLIMMIAPFGVFALMADAIVTIAGDSVQDAMHLLTALGYYIVTVVVALVAHVLLAYGSMLKIWTNIPLREFYSKINPAQLIAFSTSSSGASLPVTMRQCGEGLGASPEVSSFVIPLGSTINMDGTAIYQAVSAVFIAQALGLDLSITQQLTIILTAVLASIGTPAVPGAGVIMLVVILEAINVPADGIALILGVERILDMLRTTANVTGDATVCMIVDAKQKQLATSGHQNIAAELSK
ncbi:MAG: dicarboxylate/amino acid:cation symporter [Pseudomonadota bacterium]